MTESSIQPPPGARLMFASRHPPSNAGSPSHHQISQPPDDFISHLSPMTALDAFLAPTGPLKACMATATATEQSFAIRAAVASKNIYEWLDELRDWSWPAQGGLGFQTPASPETKFSSRGRSGSAAEYAPGEEEEKAMKPGDTYIGSLLESTLARYEARLDQIQAELDKLQMEEIKSHVLHNHIMPLSRPGTPASPTLERQFRMGAFASYTKMDDMTAVVTATVVQALPNLSKLIRLMNTWGIRLTVLRRIPTWLSSVVDAESAVQAGWTSVESESEPRAEASLDGQSSDASVFSKQDYDVMKLVLEKKVSKAAQNLDYMLDSLEGRDDTLPDEWLDRMEKVEREYAEWTAVCERKLRDAEAAAHAKQTAREKSSEVTPQENETFYDNTVVINVEDTDEPSQFADESAEVSFNDADQPIPSVEDGEACDESPDISTTDLSGYTQSSGNRAMSETDLDGDDFSLESIEAESDSSVLRVAIVPRSSIVVKKRTRDPARTPEPATSNSRNSPHTPPRDKRSVSMPSSDMPPVPEDPEDDDDPLQTPLTSCYDSASQELGSPIILSDPSGQDDHMSKQISEILENLPAKIQLSSKPASYSHLNPPDLQLPYAKPRSTADKSGRSKSTMSSRASMASRAGTPAFMLAPVARPRHQHGNQDIKMYHLSRANGEAPIKLFIRCVGEHGERVMVRVGGGWADLGEYLKEYAVHHSRRSNHGRDSKVEVRDIPRSVSSMSNRPSASPPNRPSSPSRPVSAVDTSPIFVRKTRKASAGEDLLGPRLPRTPLAYTAPRASEPPSSGSTTSGSTGIGRSRSNSRLSWTEGEESSLGMAGPRSSRKEISQQSLEWVESIKEKVRAASGGSDLARSAPAAAAAAAPANRGESPAPGKFGQLGKVGGTKRVFRRPT